MKTYAEITQWLFTQLPVYQNQGASAYKPGLEKMQTFAAYLGNPQMDFPSIHVAGTNGKGSTSHMLAAALQSMGHKVGLYTSPHLLDFSERIRVNGEVVEQGFVIDFVLKHKDYFIAQQLSFFEITVGMAFAYFVHEQVDYAIVEVGLGGRLDATNIITPQLAVITNIGLDHTEFLGENLTAIAQEKAGIIKPNTPVVVGETIPLTLAVFEEKAKEQNAELVLAEEQEVPEFPIDLLGSYQEKNRRTAYTALKTLLGQSVPKAAQEGFAHVALLTGLRARWEIVRTAPNTVVDVTHNAEGFVQVVEQLKKINAPKLHLVLGFVQGKAIEEILALLPRNAVFYFCAPSIARARPVEEVAEVAQGFDFNYTIYSTSNEAFAAAQNSAADEDFVYVGGSTFLAAEFLSLGAL